MTVLLTGTGLRDSLLQDLLGLVCFTQRLAAYVADSRQRGATSLQIIGADVVANATIFAAILGLSSY